MTMMTNDMERYQHEIFSFLNAANAQISNIMPSDWAEANRMMTQDVSPIPGKFSFDNSPYTREILDCFHPSHPAKNIVIMKGAQIGFSTGVIENAIGWIISQNPGNILCLAGHEAILSDTMRKFDVMIDNSGIRHLIRNTSNRAKNNKSGDTDNEKNFAGGILKLGTANHGMLRGMSFRFGFIDDYERMKGADKASGSTRKMIEQRFAAYADVQKIAWISTPELKETSNIHPMYLEGDQRKLHIHCPCCNELIMIEWSFEDREGGITWELLEDGRLDRNSVGYICQECGGFFDDRNKTELIRRGKWIPTAVAKNDETVSFHISSMYSPYYMRKWHEYVQDYIDCTPVGFDRDSEQEERYKTFVNLVLGYPYEKTKKTTKATELMKNIRGYEAGVIPEKTSIHDGNGKIIMLTLGSDLNGTEDDARLDWEIVAHSETGATYSIDHGSIGTFIPKDKKSDLREKWTYRHGAKNSVWAEFETILRRRLFKDSDGTSMIVLASTLDSGYMTNYAYDFSDKVNDSLFLFLVKGDDHDKEISEYASIKNFRPSSERSNLFLVPSNYAKDKLSIDMSLSWDKVVDSRQPSGFMNFPQPIGDKYTLQNYFSHFEAEHKVLGKNNKFVWKKKQSHLQNHLFDCRIYALVARDIFVNKYLNECKIKNGSWSDFVTIVKSKWDEKKKT